MKQKNYTPPISGARALGKTLIVTVDNCGGYGKGANLYNAIFPDGTKVDSFSYNGYPMGYKNFIKYKIKPWYIERLKLA